MSEPPRNEWPGELRRRPPRDSSSYLVRAPLAAWLAAEARAAAAARPGGGSYRVLDIGCGAKPYYPFFEPYASAYVGVDIGGNPLADLEGPVEALPVGDGEFDVVLCTQVLEHCDDPAQAARELRRVTAPGGRVLASTHGVEVYHPAPTDHWRWTHTGLERLFRDNGAWSSVSVVPGAGTAACLGKLAATYVDHVSRRARVPGVGRLTIRAINRAAPALDRRLPLLSDPRQPGTLFANYHVTAIT
jgi:SAM-dependent methyltransferase